MPTSEKRRREMEGNFGFRRLYHADEKTRNKINLILAECAIS